MKKRGVPRWLVWCVGGVIAVVLAGFLANRIYVEKTKPIDQKAYEAAINMVDRDLLSNIDPYYEEYDPKYIKWISLDLLQIEVNVSFVQNGVWDEIKYRVYVDIEDGKCLPGIPERILEN